MQQVHFSGKCSCLFPIPYGNVGVEQCLQDDIIIKSADKGGAVVVWRRDLYIAEAERQLNNEMFYEKLDKDPTDEHQKCVKSTVTELTKNGALPPSARLQSLPE